MAEFFFVFMIMMLIRAWQKATLLGKSSPATLRTLSTGLDSSKARAK